MPIHSVSSRVHVYMYVYVCVRESIYLVQFLIRELLAERIGQASISTGSILTLLDSTLRRKSSSDILNVGRF